MFIDLKVPNTKYFDRSETLVRYYADIRKYDVLTQQDEIKLFEIIKSGNKSEKRLAKQKIVNANQRFVVAMAKKFGTNDNVLDLINEGNLGLLEAIDKFDIKKETRFTTFAVNYIRREINNYNINYGSLVKKHNISKTYHVISQATNKFFQKENRKPSPQELSDILKNDYNVVIKNLVDIIDTKISSIDESYEDKEGDEYNALDSLYNAYSATANNAENVVENEFNKKLVSSMLTCLTDREATIIKLVFGIGYDREYELQEISDKVNLTTERVRQLKFSSIKKLKHAYEKALKCI